MCLRPLSFASALSLIACGGPALVPPGDTAPPAASSAPTVMTAPPPKTAPSTSVVATNDPPADEPPTIAPAASTERRGALVGADRDAHGCIGSAGYSWSELRKACVRLFEVGLRLSPVPGSGNEAGFSAFLVFATDDTTPAKNASVELFVPRVSGGMVLARANEKKGATYAKAGVAFKATFAKKWAVEKDGQPAFTFGP